MPNKDSISVYAINMKNRKERYNHIRHEFEGKTEFDFHLIEACTHVKGTIGLWNSMIKIILTAKEKKENYIVICEDDHYFTENYSAELLFKAIKEAHEQGAEILSGGIGGFGQAIPSGYHLYQINWFWCTQFIVVYASLFDKILSYTFNQYDTTDGVLSEIADNKMVIYPFISEQKDFGYSDVTPNNMNYKGLIREHFAWANSQFRNLERKDQPNFILENETTKDNQIQPMTDKKLLERFMCTQLVNSDFYLNDGIKGGKMGAIIFFFHCARDTGDDTYEDFANYLLENLFENLSENISLEFANGLCGIGWGIEYLLQHGFVEGDRDEVLSDIDKYIINEICYHHMTGLSLNNGIVGLGHYILMRLRPIWRHKDTFASLALKENLIYLIDWIGELMKVSDEPKDDLLNLLQELYKNEFYKTKVREMIQQCTP